MAKEYVKINEHLIAEHKSKMNHIRARYGNMTPDIAYIALQTHELGEIKQLLIEQVELLKKIAGVDQEQTPTPTPKAPTSTPVKKTIDQLTAELEKEKA